jgi:hypothetical protein
VYNFVSGSPGPADHRRGLVLALPEDRRREALPVRLGDLVSGATSGGGGAEGGGGDLSALVAAAERSPRRRLPGARSGEMEREREPLVISRPGRRRR